MRYQPGQLVKCIRAVFPGHEKLVGNIGEIQTTLTGFEIILYGFEYVVKFPCYPEGICSHCDKYHAGLVFMMLHKELGPIEDPDGQTIEVGKTLILELTQ